ncbi:hypothetical protein P3S67_000643 [Capsicum chacoense]
MAEKKSNSSEDGRWTLQGKNALVTGGTKGIGHAIVEELAGFGTRVYTCRNQDQLDQCLEKWRGKGYKVEGCVCDLTLRPQREMLMEKVIVYFQGKLNSLIQRFNEGDFGDGIELVEDYVKEGIIVGFRFRRRKTYSPYLSNPCSCRKRSPTL